MQLVWFNKFIKINNKPVRKLFNTQLFVGDLYRTNKLMSWQSFKLKFELSNKDFFQMETNNKRNPERMEKLD